MQRCGLPQWWLLNHPLRRRADSFPKTSKIARVEGIKIIGASLVEQLKKVEDFRTTDGRRHPLWLGTYEIIILTPFGDYALLSHLSYQQNQEFAFEINDFIISDQTYLSVYQNQRNYVFFFSLFMLTAMAIGAFFATTPVTNCTFYKSLNKVFIERKGLRSQPIIEFPLESILRFDIQDKEFKYSKLYRDVIVLQYYQEIPINTEYTDEKSVQYAVSRIRYFLNIGNS
ncbi:hypothetical protein [Nostoc sp. 106C]|uniref:hypothetical protein n=1 Tax=Nostoc sp. 106C TaxID=1932667 RepID=UPI001FB576FE|nr:hypothetical protein [Nostoc sp. 106C]